MNSIHLTAKEREIFTKMLVSHAYRELLAANRLQVFLQTVNDRKKRSYLIEVMEEEQLHYNGVLKVAREFNINLEKLVQQRYAGKPAGIPFYHTWLDFLLAHAFNDQAGFFVLQGIQGSKVRSYAQLAKKIVRDEERHGHAGVKLLVDYLYHKKLTPKMKRSIKIHLDAAVRCLGKPLTENDTLAVEAGLKTVSSAETIQRFCGYMNGVFKKLNYHEFQQVVAGYHKTKPQKSKVRAAVPFRNSAAKRMRKRRL